MDDEDDAGLVDAQVERGGQPGGKSCGPRTTSHPPEAPSMSSRPSATSRSLCSGSPSEPSCQRSGRDPRRPPGLRPTGSAGRPRSSARSSRAARLRRAAVPSSRPTGGRPRAFRLPLVATRLAQPARRPRPPVGESIARIYSDWLAWPQPTAIHKSCGRGGKSLSDIADSRPNAEADAVASRSGAARDDEGLRRNSRRRCRKPRRLPRRNPRATRPERGRQVDAHQDARRRLQAGCGEIRLDGASYEPAADRGAASPSSIRISA